MLCCARVRKTLSETLLQKTAFWQKVSDSFHQKVSDSFWPKLIMGKSRPLICVHVWMPEGPHLGDEIRWGASWTSVRNLSCPDVVISNLTVGQDQNSQDYHQGQHQLGWRLFFWKQDELGRLALPPQLPDDVDAFNRNITGGLNGLDRCANLGFASNSGLQDALAFSVSVKSDTGIPISHGYVCSWSSFRHQIWWRPRESIPFHHDGQIHASADLVPEPPPLSMGRPSSQALAWY
jgi:hypothetical protein